MSDHAQPGWWLAADGRWYPPEQHPEYGRTSPVATWEPPGGASVPLPSLGTAPPPFLGARPTAPERRTHPWKIVAILGVAALLVAAAAVVFVGSTGKKADTSPQRTADTLAPIGVTPEGFVEIVDSRHEFTIAFPADWTAAEIRGDISHVGQTLMPDDPEIASRLDQAANSTLPRSAVIVGFLRGDLTGSPGFATNVNLIPTPVDTGVSLDTIVRQSAHELEKFGATIHATESTTMANGPAKRVEYTLTSAGIDGVQYYVLANGQVWVLTFSTQDFAANSAEFDQIAGTFVVSP